MRRLAIAAAVGLGAAVAVTVAGVLEAARLAARDEYGITG